MTDLQETPAVPPFDPKGDERAGLLAAGTILIVFGWGFAVGLNLLLHYYAPSGGHWIGGVYFGTAIGEYAWAVFAFGLFTGALGVALLALGRATPKGPLVLPGADY